MSTVRRRTISFLLIFSLLIGIVGIVNVDTTYAATKKIHLKKTSISLVEGKTYQQKLIDKNGKTIKATKIKWKSSKTSVAKINKKGKITAVKAGTAKMTAKYKGKTYKFTIKVRGPNLNLHWYSTPLSDWSDANGIKIRIYADWDKLESDDFSKYVDIFVSINGSEFEYYDTQFLDEDSDILYTNNSNSPIYGKYTFKLRGVCGEYIGEFSKEKSITIDPGYNTKLSFDSQSLSLKKGEVTTLTLHTDFGKACSWKTGDTSVITVEKGGWAQGGSHDYNFIITGKKAGTSSLMVWDTKNSSVTVTISITVTDSSSGGGDNPSGGDWTITCKQSLPTKSGVYYSSGRIMYLAEIESVSLTPSNNYFTIEVIGTMITYDGGGGALLYRVYDQDGFVVEDSMISSNATSSGLRFKAQSKCYLTNPKGSYTLEFYIEHK